MARVEAVSHDILGECVRTAFPAPAPVNPNLSYTYRTDQELVQASQIADAYCQKYGSQPMMRCEFDRRQRTIVIKAEDPTWHA